MAFSTLSSFARGLFTSVKWRNGEGEIVVDTSWQNSGVAWKIWQKLSDKIILIHNIDGNISNWNIAGTS